MWNSISLFLYESILLKKYESKLAKNYNFWAVSKADEQFYANHLKAKHIKYLPVFLPWSELNCKIGNGCFCWKSNGKKNIQIQPFCHQ